MRTLQSANTALSAFVGNKDAQSLLKAITKIPNPFPDEDDNARKSVESAREICLSLLNNNENINVKSGTTSLLDAGLEVALTLAEICPINLIDPFTQEEFQSSDRVVCISTGYRFGIDTLKKYVTMHGFQGLSNPFNREEFSDADKEIISKAIGLPLNTIPAANSTDDNDPLTQQAIAAALAEGSGSEDDDRSSNTGNDNLLRAGLFSTRPYQQLLDHLRVTYPNLSSLFADRPEQLEQLIMFSNDVILWHLNDLHTIELMENGYLTLDQAMTLSPDELGSTLFHMHRLIMAEKITVDEVLRLTPSQFHNVFHTVDFILSNEISLDTVKNLSPEQIEDINNGEIEKVLANIDTPRPSR